LKSSLSLGGAVPAATMQPPLVAREAGEECVATGCFSHQLEIALAAMLTISATSAVL
jgi:hypothetical protein